MKPPDSQKAMAINHLNRKMPVYVCTLAGCALFGMAQPTHGISLENALNACAKVKVLVNMLAASPIMATAPSGRGLVMIPTMVPRKMARRCHAFNVTPEGGGMNHTMAARATDIPRFFMSAPHWNSDDDADAAATTGRLLA